MSNFGWFAYAPSGATTGGPPPGRALPDGPDPGRAPELADVGRLARRGMRSVLRVARADEIPTPGRLVRDFLGDVIGQGDIVEETWASYEYVNVERAVAAWTAGARRSRLVGLTAEHHEVTLAGILASDGASPGFAPSIGAVSRVNLPSGPGNATLACARCALHLVELGPDETERVALLQQEAAPMFGRNRASVQIAASDPSLAARVGRELRESASRLNVFRGQVVSFDGDMFGGRESVLHFHERPTMTRDDLILDDEVLHAIERHVIGVARHRDALLAAGQHLRRGVLLYGPPGVGKTHTVRYLMSVLRDVTVVQVSGSALHLIAEACSAARTLAPSMVVVEDVDLIAEDRGMHPGEHPLLFQLLNEMDGVGGDADVAFVLTTNRADLLELALAARPGRIDEAVAIDLPDQGSRRRLFELYRGRLPLEATHDRIDAALARAEGVTASFIKEWLRRSALAAAERAGAAMVVTADDLDAALTGLLDTRNRMTRTLLGGGDPQTPDSEEAPHRAEDDVEQAWWNHE